MRKFLISLMVAITLFGTTGVTSAFANNHADLPFEFVLTGLEDGSEIRGKQDASSTYVSASFVGCPFRATVVGASSNAVLWPEGVDCTQGGPYNVYAPTTFFMYNQVYERGYRRAALVGDPLRVDPYTGVNARGVWSPDSV